MTKEEAAEIILGGYSWVKCHNECDGGFFYDGETYQEHTQCNMCKGTGSVIQPEYKEAVALLGLDVPQVPRDLYGPRPETRQKGLVRM